MRTRVLVALIALTMLAPVGSIAASTVRIPRWRLVRVPGSIDGSGRTDVTSALNHFLAEVPEGSAAVFPAHRRYRIEGTLTFANHRDVIVDGNGSTFFATTNGSIQPAPGCTPQSTATVCRYPNRSRSQWQFISDSSVVVENMTVIGSSTHTGPNGVYDPSLEAQHAFNIVGVDGFVLTDVVAHNTWGDLVYVGAADVDGRMVPANNVTVSNSTFHDSSRQGWSVTWASHVTFSNNRVTSARRSLIDVEANTSNATVAYLTIRNNSLGTSRFCTFSNAGAAANEHDITISANRAIADEPLQICILGSPKARRRNYRIIGNVGAVGTRTPDYPMITATYLDDLVVSGNAQHFRSNYAWPHRAGLTGSPQAPVTAVCTSVHLVNNRFSPRPPAMPQSLSKPC